VTVSLVASNKNSYF